MSGGPANGSGEVMQSEKEKLYDRGVTTEKRRIAIRGRDFIAEV